MEPAYGISGNDAITFTRWVNTVIGGETTYQLPSRAALDDPAVQRRLISADVKIQSLSVWIQSKRPDTLHSQVIPELWTSAGSRHPHEIEAKTLNTYFGSDLSDSRPLLLTLLLLQSAIISRLLRSCLYLQRAYDLRDAVVAAFNNDGDLADTLNVVRDLAIDHSLDHSDSVDHDLELAIQIAYGLRLSLVKAATSSLASRKIRDPSEAQSRAIRLANNLLIDLELALVTGNDSRPSHNVALYHSLALDHAIDLFSVGGIDDNPLPHFSYYEIFDSRLKDECSRVMGHVFFQTLAQLSNELHGVVDFEHSFRAECAKAIGFPETKYLISFDRLAQQLVTAIRELNVAITQRGDNSGSSSWVTTVSGRLEPAVVPIFRGRAQITPSTATSIRLPVLLLAAEADAIDRHDIGEKFRHIAAGITLLERRTKGDDPITETIFLSTE